MFELGESGYDVESSPMNAVAKLGGFALAVVLAFGGAYGIGQATGSVGAVPDAAHGSGQHGAAATPASGELPAGGLMVAQDGYRFDLISGHAAARTPEDFAFRILGPDGAPITAFAPDGRPEAITLGADVAVAGAYTPAALPTPSRTATVDGYTVHLDGDLVPGRTNELTLTVSKAGRPVTDLQPYLAAYGHLVALRDGDLAYLHVHPEGTPGDGRTAAGPDIEFMAEVPSPGSYRLFLDFQHRGVVRTAEFTVPAGPAADGGTHREGGHP
jgi:hypothetical protein